MFSTYLFSIAVSIVLPTKVMAINFDSNLFVGTGLTVGSLGMKDRESSSSVGVDLHAGYQLGNYLKLMVGVGSASISDGDNGEQSISTKFAVVRPQWVFDSGFLVYIDIGVVESSIENGGKFGMGIGYNEGKHEITLGYDQSEVDHHRNLSVALVQYSYHF